ncbi:hypothetical protein M8C21_025640 [Ambrosia artemisiifolia]|uniref:Uncharacterized protein n=1 Tax=Ambrosia artemisiifolia TaxID=4212 RepID=A0AAD5CWP7_AMBAR|nr:hypothetical protein M8C21_025640 [Ambrosia artemisiifolia]
MLLTFVPLTMMIKVQNPGQYKIPVVCFLIILLDLIAAILGIQAEVAQYKVQSLMVWMIGSLNVEIQDHTRYRILDADGWSQGKFKFKKILWHFTPEFLMN